MPAILLRQQPKEPTPFPSIAPRASPTDWNSWTPSQQGGVLAASLLLFLFFFGIGIFLWQRRRGRKRKERRGLKSKGRRRGRRSKKRPVPDSASPPRKKKRTKRVKLEETGEEADTDKFLMKGAVETPKKLTTEQPAENQDTPDKVNDMDQWEGMAANPLHDTANLRLQRRRERRREARRRAASGYSSTAGEALRGDVDTATKAKETPETPERSP
ncbi:hypothetical protein MGYG_02550 [Nannizzia gypsea CBS 118893]|uniref:Uncharacterized protein n=1 Tax=Arthroderma gypseum (strain ATCC MYA-4604 / CBS 118893) TaxID=535722 RepID=E4UN77_ARTGP|nr:hypothetical protein MGYG_02550 [Nannizzia gypsea CBS 118893]EFQ99538.1 hypothetical protein MGYG_02550 [Nannizzia gypsea CBS 118893]